MKHKYRFEVKYLPPQMVRVSNLMNAFDFQGRFGVQTDVVTFSSTTRGISPQDYKAKLTEAYATEGGEVLEVSGGEIV